MIPISKDSFAHTLEKWKWKVSYCKEQGWNPRFSRYWIAATQAWEVAHSTEEIPELPPSTDAPDVVDLL